MERLSLPEIKPRSEISWALNGLLAACTSVIEEHRQYWPLSLRQIHYRLLSKEVIKNRQTGERYVNDLASYRALSRLLSRARINGLVDWEAIEDATRPVDLGGGWPDPEAFYQDEWRSFLTGYVRDLMQSQPDHVEIVAEKLTVQTILRPIAERYTIPLTIMRGACSVTTKQAYTSASSALANPS